MKTYIDFHDAAVNVIVGSNFELDQFITWDGDKTFFVYEFSEKGSKRRIYGKVSQVDRFNLKEPCNVYDAKLHAKSYFADLLHFRQIIKMQEA